MKDYTMIRSMYYREFSWLTLNPEWIYSLLYFYDDPSKPLLTCM